MHSNKYKHAWYWFSNCEQKTGFEFNTFLEKKTLLYGKINGRLLGDIFTSQRITDDIILCLTMHNMVVGGGSPLI